MRCPQCTERNSVAARKCEFCGEKFKRKPLPLGLKLGTAGILVALTATIAASYVVPKLVDPEQNLARVAKRVAAGPRSVDDANRSKAELSNAIRTYLKNNGSDKTNELTAGLQKLLPSTTYEVHIAELPRGLRVVEIDTVLQATDFLLMKTASSAKVFDLPGFEVFDDARILNDTAGPVMALIGHSGGQPPHKPMVKTYALLPDFVSDESEKLVPALKREGTAKFAANNQDIQLELISKGAKKGAHEEISYGLLHWKEAKYVTDFSDKTASFVRQHFKDVQVASTPTPVADHPASPPPASAAAAPAVAVTTGSSTEKIAATASPVLANALAHAHANFDRASEKRSKPAKIVVRGLTDSNSANSLISQLPPAAAASRSAGFQPATVPPVAPSVVPAKVKPETAPPTAPTAGSRPPVQKNAGAPPAPLSRSASYQPASASSSAVAQATQSSSKHDKHHKSETTTASSGHKHSLAVISCAGGATLRATAARGGASLGGLSTGTQVEILGHSKEWYHVRNNGRDGYIFASLLDTSGKMAPNPPETAVSTSGSHKRHHHHGVLVADIGQHQSTHSEVATNTSSTSTTHTSSSSSSHSKHHKHGSSAPAEAPTMVP